MQPIAKQRASGAPSPSQVSSSFPAISYFPVCRRRSRRRRRFALRICLGIALLSTFGARPADAGTAPVSSVGEFESGDPFAAWIAEAGRRFDIPASWIRDVMHIESHGDARAVSPKGAMGLMQLMPETWADLRLRYGLGGDPFDPRDNILAGAAYLRELHDRFGDAGFLAAYNAGPARYEAFLATGRPLPDETRAYLGALAPLTADGTAEARLTVASKARSWTGAPLFALLAARSSAAHRLSFAVHSEHTSAVARVADLTGFVPQSAGLFVAVSHRISTR
jgi:soluble lytic murein transglycosylase-like protein